MPKRIGFLYEKMVDKEFIRNTILLAAKGRRKRFDIEPVLNHLDEYVDAIYVMLLNGAFEPSPGKEKRIYDVSSQKPRKLTIVPFYPDALIQWCVVEVLKPVMLRGMMPWTCASIPQRGSRRVREHIKRIMREDPENTKYCAELDIHKFYPSIPLNGLMRFLEHKIKDKRLLELIRKILESYGPGLPIGFYLCQWLANFYLESLDHFVMDQPGVAYMTRYMDNLDLFGPTSEGLHAARIEIAKFLPEKLQLDLKSNWQVYPTASRRVAAVGYRYAAGHTILRKRNFLRLTRQCRRVRKKQQKGLPISFSQASGVISRIGQLKHCDSKTILQKYVGSLNTEQLKEVIHNESKRRPRTRKRIHRRADSQPIRESACEVLREPSSVHEQ